MLTPVVKEPILRGLFEYWEKKRRGRRMPERADIDPVEIDPAILPWLLLLDVTEGAENVRYSLVGTEIVGRLGCDPTGLYFRDFLTGSYLTYAIALCREICDNKVPCYAESVFRWDVSGHLLAKRVYLPLSWAGLQPGMIVAAQVFDSRPSGTDLHTILVRADLAFEDQVRERGPWTG